MRESDSFYIINREEWKKLNNHTEISLSDQEVESLRSLNDQVSVKDVKEIYLPILQILHQYLKHYHKRQKEIKKNPESTRVNRTVCHWYCRKCSSWKKHTGSFSSDHDGQGLSE